jgi:hypothetical protein
MLRAVLNEVEVVPSSSSNLREAAVACGHPFEHGGGSSAAAVRSVVGARLKVERGVLPDVGRDCLSARVDRAALGFEARSSGAGRLSTPAKLEACKDPGLDLSWPASSPRPKSCQKRRAAQPGASSGRLPPFQAITVCERSRFEELWGPAARRR